MSFKRGYSSTQEYAPMKRTTTYNPKRIKGKRTKLRVATKSNNAFVAKVQKAMIRISDPKYYQSFAYGQGVGQLFGAVGSGHHTSTFNGPTFGTGQQSRIGNKILLTGIEIGLTHWAQGLMPDQSLKIHFVLFKGNDGGQFAMSEYLERNEAVNQSSIATLGGGPYIIYDTSCAREQSFNEQYTTIKTIELTFPGANMTSNATFPINNNKYWIPCKDIEYHYNDSASQPVNNIIYMVTVCSSGNRDTVNASSLTGVPRQTVATGFNFNYTSKLHFRDI